MLIEYAHNLQRLRRNHDVMSRKVITAEDVFLFRRRLGLPGRPGMGLRNTRRREDEAIEPGCNTASGFYLAATQPEVLLCGNASVVSQLRPFALPNPPNPKSDPQNPSQVSIVPADEHVSSKTDYEDLLSKAQEALLLEALVQLVNQHWEHLAAGLHVQEFRGISAALKNIENGHPLSAGTNQRLCQAYLTYIYAAGTPDSDTADIKTAFKEDIRYASRWMIFLGLLGLGALLVCGEAISRTRVQDAWA
ncbi:hypothetical protein B7494_g4571 [Chlorociboria aeruginascens]|nr:hypothetical protein B7494_g4571 [Chlorociboria aeruginascens]